MECGREILFRDGLADLRRVHYGRMEDRFIGKKRVKSLDITFFDDAMPGFDWVWLHPAIVTFGSLKSFVAAGFFNDAQNRDGRLRLVHVALTCRGVT